MSSGISVWQKKNVTYYIKPIELKGWCCFGIYIVVLIYLWHSGFLCKEICTHKQSETNGRGKSRHFGMYCFDMVVSFSWDTLNRYGGGGSTLVGGGYSYC